MRIQNTKRCWALLAACGFTLALGAAAVRAETDDKTIDLSASDKKVQVWHKSADGQENLIDISQSALDSHLAHGDRLAAPTTSSNVLPGPLGAPVMGEQDAAGSAGGTAATTGAASTPATTSTTGTPATTGTTPEAPASPAPASSPAAALPGSDVSPLGAPLAGSASAAALDVSKAFTGLVNAVPSTIEVKTFKLTDAGLALDRAQLDSLDQQIAGSPGAAQNRAALEDQLEKENLITADQKVIGVLPETKEILYRRADGTLPAAK